MMMMIGTVCTVHNFDDDDDVVTFTTNSVTLWSGWCRVVWLWCCDVHTVWQRRWCCNVHYKQCDTLKWMMSCDYDVVMCDRDDDDFVMHTWCDDVVVMYTLCDNDDFVMYTQCDNDDVVMYTLCDTLCLCLVRDDDDVITFHTVWRWWCCNFTHGVTERKQQFANYSGSGFVPNHSQEEY